MVIAGQPGSWHRFSVHSWIIHVSMHLHSKTQRLHNSSFYLPSILFCTACMHKYLFENPIWFANFFPLGLELLLENKSWSEFILKVLTIIHIKVSIHMLRFIKWWHHLLNWPQFRPQIVTYKTAVCICPHFDATMVGVHGRSLGNSCFILTMWV